MELRNKMNTNTQQNLLTVPNSLHQQIQRAQDLLDDSEDAHQDGNYVLAKRKAREGLLALETVAQSCPEVAALLLAGQHGYRGYEFETIERVDNYQVIERKFLGLTIGQDVINVPKTTRRLVRGRLF